jgi:hypothetical protein
MDVTIGKKKEKNKNKFFIKYYLTIPEIYLSMVLSGTTQSTFWTRS